MEIDKKRLRIICIIIVIVCLLVSLAVYAGIKIHEYNIGISFLDDGEYKKAAIEFSKVSSITFLRTKYEKEIEDVANQIYEDLYYGDITSDEAYKNIKALGKIAKVDEILKRLENLDISINNYNNGKELKDEGKYAEAIDTLSLVKNEEEYYDKAQTLIHECVEIIKIRTVIALEQYKKEKNYEDALLMIENNNPYLKKDYLKSYKEIFEKQKSECQQKEESNNNMLVYKGIWTSSDELKIGIIELTIHSIDSEFSCFSISYSDKFTEGQTATAKNIIGTVLNNIISAEYKDNYGNRGSITLTLNENKIFVAVRQNLSTDKAFSMECKGTCYKQEIVGEY